DLDEKRMALAEKFGAERCFTPDQAGEITKLTNGYGADATIITAATDSDKPLNQAMELTRKRGTVVVVGAVGLHLQRSPWYQKEIDLKISCSYGPGRYDTSYEEDGLDYPLPYARWTENRNMEAYLQLLAEGKVNFEALVEAEFNFEDAPAAYEKIKSERPLATLLKYSSGSDREHRKIEIRLPARKKESAIRIALIGAGGFAASTHLPNLEKMRDLFHLQAVCSKRGTTAKQHATRFEANYCTTDYKAILADDEVDAVLIATRHNMHARLVLEALQAGKAVFVEKPLALNEDELIQIENFYRENPEAPLLMTGFNRRFSPYAEKIKELADKRSTHGGQKTPLIVHYRMNAGFIPGDHWVHGAEGGGRIIGEGCHLLDLFNYWTGSTPVKIEAQSIAPRGQYRSDDNISTTITYADGSLCHLLYTSLGNRDLPKEYAEVYIDGAVAILDDYKNLKLTGTNLRGISGISQDKGHAAELQAFAHGIKTGTWPISLEDQLSVTRTSFAVDGMVR
ncbi:oxidoreductase, partial [Candidatus Peregrinibacteria bacterium CG11_big_fil_rev_8_21_14_0_20_46_8]